MFQDTVNIIETQKGEGMRSQDAIHKKKTYGDIHWLNFAE